MRAILLERNKLVNRRLVRFFTCAGLKPVSVADPADVEQHLGDAQLIAADAFDGDLVAQAVARNPQLRAVLWTSEPIERALRHVIEHDRISNIFGRPDFESTPRDWELAMVLRRLSRPADGAPPFSTFLNWGFTGFQDKVGGSQARDEAVGKVGRFIGQLGVPKRIGEMYAELAHEMLMNALFDAPVDSAGNHKYALDRKADITLLQEEQPLLRLATDGKRLVISVSDPFGGLRRNHVFAGLARGLKGGEMDQSHGGAGLGMVVCHNSTVVMVYDVQPGKQTEAIGVFDLDLNLREFRTQGKSLHFFQA